MGGGTYCTPSPNCFQKWPGLACWRFIKMAIQRGVNKDTRPHHEWLKSTGAERIFKNNSPLEKGFGRGGGGVSPLDRLNLLLC